MKVSAKYWDDLKEFEREYIRQRQTIDSVHELKLKINAARRQYPNYVNIYGKGFIVLPDGTELLWSGSDTKKYNLIETKMSLKIELEKAEKGRYDVNYQNSVDGEEIEITGQLIPYNTGRDTDYNFEPDWYSDEAAEKYYDDNWEEITKQCIAQIGTKNKKIKAATNKLNMNDLSVQKSEAEIIAEIESKVKASCKTAHYESLCQRIQTPAGLAYVVNRCISMMAKNTMHLSACLAQLEAEEEGLD